MKTIHNSIKIAMIKVTVIAAILLMVSCNDNQNQKAQDNKVVAEEFNNEEFDTDRQEEDEQFLVYAAETNLEQIQLGKLAQQKGKSEPIKELGKAMEAAHTKSLYELNALAKNKMITLPTSITDDAQEDYDNLNGKSSNEFDKAYAEMMVSKHTEAVETFDEASTERNDADIKNWAATSLPEQQKHLDQSIVCQKNLDDRK